MLDITTIILTYNEEIHIKRCLENVCIFSKKVYVVDSPSTDRTVEICGAFPNVEVVVHKYPGNQAEQFNWALDNLKVDTEWVLRVDADEYLTPELITELEHKLPVLPPSVSAVVLPLGRAFMGRRLRHGIVNGVKMIRLFRLGKARYEQRLMDEHLQVSEGATLTFENPFVDDNRLPLRLFIDKHNNYSSREAAVLLDAEYSLTDSGNEIDAEFAEEVANKRAQKAKYAKMPLFWRAIGYFFYRYVVKLGFLDGKEGFCWDFFQGLWYRMLVDAKVFECKKACGLLCPASSPISEEQKQKVKDYLLEHYKISLST